MIRYLTVFLILCISLQNCVAGHPLVKIKHIICQSCVFLGDIFYDQSKYDSAFIAYSTSYYLINGSNPRSINHKKNKHNIKSKNSRHDFNLCLKIGKALYYLGEYDNSIDFLNDPTCCSFKNAKSYAFQGIRHYYLGMAFNKIYKYDESLLNYSQSLEYYNKLKHENSNTIGLVYCDIGNVYYNLENYNKALDYYNRSYQRLIFQKEPNISKLSIIKNNIGSIHYRIGNIDSAIYQYKEAIRLIRFGDINPYDISMYLNNLAGIYLSINETDSAELYYNQSLRIRKNSLQNNNLLVQSHNQMGLLYLITQNYKKSLHHFQQAIIHNAIHHNDTSIFSTPSLFKTRDYMLLGISLYYKAIALNEIYQINPEENYRFLAASYSTFDYLHSYFEYIYMNETRPESLQAYISFNREVVNTVLDILKKNNCRNNNYWFTLFQRGKSILLYQNFLDSKAKKFADIPESLISKEKSMRNSINVYDRRVESAVKSGMDFTDFDGFLALVIARKNKINGLDSIIRIFEQDYPQYYQIKYNFKSIPLDQFQKKIEYREAVIEYHIADSTLYSICISADSIIVHSQTTDSIFDIIRQHIRSIKFYDNSLLFHTGTLLYRRLILPFSEILKDCEQITIIPDQGLSLFPFETLIRVINNSPGKYAYLIEDMAIGYHFSTSLWYEKKCEIKVNQPSLFAIAPFQFKNTLGISTGNRLHELPFTEREILLIKELFDERSLNNLSLIDRDATKGAFLENAPKYDIIHLATHNIYDIKQPDQSGILFFSDNDSTNSNLLSIEETYNLMLRSQLVVLSACMTGAGKLLSGEGAITLYRGFFYSGASNIIFTLWNAPDKNTFEFMKTLYNNLFEGLSYSSALRKTKISFINNNKTALPVFWGNYLILGN